MKAEVLFTVLCNSLLAATQAQPTVKTLVEAEKAFASYTEKNSIRDGFLRYMDSSGVIFQQGKPVNALAYFSKQTAGPMVLSWEPAFAVISAAGDLGVTTGPYWIRKKSLTDTPFARGHFSSIWKTNASGEWKNRVDLGIHYTTTSPAVNAVNTIALVKKELPPTPFTTLLDMDASFNQSIKDKRSVLLLSQIAPDSWLNAEGELPVQGNQRILNFLLHVPDTIYFTPITGSIAASNDMAYVYGSVMNGTKKENYLRVWIQRNRKWQVILQTIKW